MSTFGTMMKTTEIGYAKQKQYGASNSKRHSVVKDERDQWVLRCNGKPATREYKGWVETVNCQSCQRSMKEES